LLAIDYRGRDTLLSLIFIIGALMILDYLKSRDWKTDQNKLAVGLLIILVIGYCAYQEYRVRREIREHNAKIDSKFREIKQDFKFLKQHVKAFEGSRWAETVPNVQDMTMILGNDLEEFDKILKQTPNAVRHLDNDEE
jgi:hypothetical protein